jgi:hypothetical protein
VTTASVVKAAVQPLSEHRTGRTALGPPMDSRSNEGRIRDNRGTKKRPLDVWEESAMDRDQQSLVGVIRHVQAPRLEHAGFLS